MERLLTASALPSLHPAIVHFPIALLLLAPAFDLAALVLRRRPWVSYLGATVWVLAALGAGLAYWSGEGAAEAAAITDAGAMVTLEAHEISAGRTLWAAGLLAALRLLLTAWSAWRSLPGLLPPLSTLVLGPLALLLVVRTADLGGRLVYRHGVGVSAAAEELVPVATPAP